MCSYVRLNAFNVLHVHGPRFNAPVKTMMPKYIFYFNLSGFYNHKYFENEDEKIFQLMDLTQIILDYTGLIAIPFR